MKLILIILLTVVSLTASAQLKVGDQPTIQQKAVALDVQGSNGQQGLWLPRVSDTSVTGIRALNPPDGLVIYHPPAAKLFLRSNNAWITFNSNSLTTITAGGSTMSGPGLTHTTGSSGTDFNISSSGNTTTWNLPTASAVGRGLASTTIQSFAGLKTFNNGLTVNNGSTLNNGTTANGGLTVSGATTNTSNLILGITSAITPAATGDRYLSVNASGNVTLNAINGVTNVTAGGSAMYGPALTYNTGSSGTNFNITSSGNTTTWNLPGASPLIRGVVNTATQNFGGLKTFNNGIAVNNGAYVTGATGAVTKLKLGVTSATVPDSFAIKFLSVDATGKVILARPLPGIFGSDTIICFTLSPLEFPLTVDNNKANTITFKVPAGTNLRNPATVVMSPSSIINERVSINWVRVTDATTITASLAVEHGANINFAAGYMFYITVMMY